MVTETYDDDESRLKVLETQGVKTEGRLTHVENTLLVHGGKLDQIITAVNTFSGRPIFDVHKVISSVRDVIVIAGAASTLAVWFVLTLTAADQKSTQLELKHIREMHNVELQQMKERLAWSTAKWATTTETKTEGRTQ